MGATVLSALISDCTVVGVHVSLLDSDPTLRTNLALARRSERPLRISTPRTACLRLQYPGVVSSISTLMNKMGQDAAD